MIYPLEISFRKLRRYFSRNEWLLRRSRLSKSEDTSSEPGLLLIQIDGLSYHQMERAMTHGRARVSTRPAGRPRMVDRRAC